MVSAARGFTLLSFGEANKYLVTSHSAYIYRHYLFPFEIYPNYPFSKNLKSGVELSLYKVNNLFM